VSLPWNRKGRRFPASTQLRGVSAARCDAVVMMSTRQIKRSRDLRDMRLNIMNRFRLSVLAISCFVVASVSADDNVRFVQTKLKDGGFYFGEVNGNYDSKFSAALTRYQIRNGLAITGQLDKETSKALGAKPAAAPSASDPALTSETWRSLRKSDQQFLRKLEAQQNRAATATPSDVKVPSAQSNPPPDTASIHQKTKSAPLSVTETQGAPRNTAEAKDSSGWRILDKEGFRDYIAAFVLAGLDPKVGAELEFFGDRVRYYDDGWVDRAKIREDLRRYAARWPERHFWLAGDVRVEPQSRRQLRVTFPLRYDLRNGAKHSSGKIQKTLLLEVAGNDLQIVAVNESKARQ
jgi:peptidoglycan hydrolase-like protein with peptidoglycan-binding domain